MLWLARKWAWAAGDGSEAKWWTRGICNPFMAYAAASIPEQSVPSVSGRNWKGSLARLLGASTRWAGGAASSPSQFLSVMAGGDLHTTYCTVQGHRGVILVHLSLV